VSLISFNQKTIIKKNMKGYHCDSLFLFLPKKFAKKMNKQSVNNPDKLEAISNNK